jgi:DDE superfamily endonuclease
MSSWDQKLIYISCIRFSDFCPVQWSQPDPDIYQERKEALEILIEEDKEGVIDLRYYDESGFCLVPYIPYAWQEQGETISIESGHSKRINVCGLMNTRNELEAYTIEGSVDSEVVIRFFNEFCDTIQGPTVVVVDNASIHTSEAFSGSDSAMGDKRVIDFLPTAILSRIESD